MLRERDKYIQEVRVFLESAYSSDPAESQQYIHDKAALNISEEI
jgi:hypothetical protein